MTVKWTVGGALKSLKKVLEKKLLNTRVTVKWIVVAALKSLTKALEKKKTVEYEGDSEMNCSWCT